MGVYLVRVLDVEGKTLLDPIMGPVERLLYLLLRVDPKQEQDWKQYTFFTDRFQSRGSTLYVRNFAAPTIPAIESASLRGSERSSFFHYCGEFHHQHELAKLRR